MAQDDCTVSLLPAGQRDGHAGWDEHHEDHPLMGEFDHGLMKNGYNPDTTAWQVLHVLAFLTGGTTFIAGMSNSNVLFCHSLHSVIAGKLRRCKARASHAAVGCHPCGIGPRVTRATNRSILYCLSRVRNFP